MGVGENGVTHLGRHKVPSVQSIKIIAAEIVNVRTIDAVRKSHLLKEARVLVDNLTTLFENSASVPAKNQFNGQSKTNWTTSYNKTI